MTSMSGGNDRAITAATNAAKIGVAPFSIPVTLLDTCCSANGNTVSGAASQTTPSKAIFGHAADSTGTRDFGMKVSVRQPNNTRIGVIRPGAKESRPTAMK